MLGGAMGPILTGALSALDLRAPFLAGGLIYLALTIPAALIARRAAPDGGNATGEGTAGGRGAAAGGTAPPLKEATR
jgi:hypothetical protein